MNNHFFFFLLLKPTQAYLEVVGVELGVGRSLSLEPGGWGGGKLSKFWGGTNLVRTLLLSMAAPEDGVEPETWVLLPHLSVESSLFVSCWCRCMWWLEDDNVWTWRPPPKLEASCKQTDLTTLCNLKILMYLRTWNKYVLTLHWVERTLHNLPSCSNFKMAVISYGRLNFFFVRNIRQKYPLFARDKVPFPVHATVHSSQNSEVQITLKLRS